MAEEQDNSSIQGSDLDENAKQWEKELTSESDEDETSTDEDNQLTQEEESEEESEEELEADSEDDEAEEEVEVEEEEPEEELFEVKSDGKTHQVSLQELKDSYSKGQNYTRKSQALADDRNSLEDSKAEISQLREQTLQALEFAKQNQPKSPERTDEYWNNLRDTDPVQFLIERDAVRDSQMQTQVVDNEIARLNSQKEAEQIENLEKHIDGEKTKLLDLIPEWSDTKLADTEKKLVMKFGLKQGFSQQELDTAYDSRAVATLRKAALFDQLQEKKKGIKSVKRSSMKPGSKSGDPSKIKTGKAMERLKKSGSIDDAAAVFYNHIRS
mgnify:CR=1 FL=1